MFILWVKKHAKIDENTKSNKSFNLETESLKSKLKKKTDTCTWRIYNIVYYSYLAFSFLFHVLCAFEELFALKVTLFHVQLRQAL